jgi:prevent-host-death family protein
MKTATIRDLRTRFPEVRKLLEREGEVVVTDRGKPVVVLRSYDARSEGRIPTVPYYERLRRHMPKRLSKAKRQALDEADRAER